MIGALDEIYFNWLTSQITVQSRRHFDGLFKEMFSKQFVWTVPNDDNRVADGQELRSEFLQGDHYEFPFGVTFLEVLVALSRRLQFDLSDTEAGDWAWILIQNLELHRFWDPIGFRKKVQIDDILETVIWRTYSPNGEGGFFPLNHPKEDQTRIEIWYQMNHWINENFPI